MAGYDGKPNSITINLAYLIMIFSLGRMFAVGMSLNRSVWLEAGVVFLIGLVIRFLVIRPLYLLGVVIASSIGAIFVDSIWAGFYPLVRDSIFDLVNNVINNLSGVENISLENRLPLWMIVVTVISLYTSLVVFRGRERFFLPLLYVPIFLIYWYSFYDNAFALMVLFIFSYLIILGYDSLITSDSTKGTDRNELFLNLYPRWMNVVLIYSIIIALLASTLPGTSDYIRWPWLNEKVTSAFPAIEELRSGESVRRVSGNAQGFDFSTTGFQADSTRLGGPVKLDDTVVMSIRGDRVNYLRGNVRHTYTGTGWVEDPKLYQLVQKDSDFSKLSEEDKQLYYRDVAFSITNEKISSTTIFSPFQPYSFDFEGDSGALVNPDFSIVYPGGIYAGESYFIGAYTPRAFGIQVERGIDRSYDDLINSELYLELPDTITNRTVQLANAITAGIDSDIDKALAIENYLRETYDYNLDVPYLPEDTDFVDHFLFEEEQGYCTYFASSLAVLLRIEGIPTRYVEGFIVGPDNDEGLQEVRNSNAHSWVEAFIEPVGWITLEATPAYTPPARLLDYDPQVDENIEADENEGRSRDPESADGKDDGEGIGTGDVSDVEDSTNQDSTGNASSFAFLLLVVIVLIMVWRLLKGLYDLRNDGRSYKSLDNYRKVLNQYYQITQLVEKLGYRSNPGETHFEYSNRIAHKFHEFGKFGFKQATHLFVKTKYGDYFPSPDEVQAMENYNKKLEMQLKRHLGSIPYHLKKIVELFNYKRKFERK
ncbi:MAG: DUF3488 and transglutaminase-like domain-containing protein [Gudongella sp.]|nr:DUF3488 and transglutaminase-like domain-containing protein [Gudongella sp.]